MAVLSCMAPGAPEEPIFGINYESLKKIFSRACERAGVEGVGLHDLRHTATTRTAKRLNGNIFLLQAFTGHKTLSQLERYVHIGAKDVVESFKATQISWSQRPWPARAPKEGVAAPDAARRAAQMGRFTGQAPGGAVASSQCDIPLAPGARSSFASPPAVLFKQAKLPASASMSPGAGRLRRDPGRSSGSARQRGQTGWARWPPELHGCIPVVQLSAASWWV